MSRVTRCPKCETLFKVVPDQLRLSQGWVRCGSCSTVFDASEQMQHAHAHDGASGEAAGVSHPVWSLLLDDGAAASAIHERPSNTHSLSTKAPQYPSESEKNTASNAAYSETSGVTDTVILTEASFCSDGAEPQEWSSNWSHVAQDMGPNAPTLLLDQVEFVQPASDSTDSAATFDFLSDQRIEPCESAHDAREHPVLKKASDAFDAADFTVSALPNDTAENKPHKFEPELGPLSGLPTKIEPPPADDLSFVRQAKRRQFWRKPWVRASVGFAFAVGLCGFAAKWVHDERDWIAAAYPESKPWLMQACASLDCQIRPYQKLESIVIQHSEFNRLATGDFRLNLSIRNQDAITVGVPSLTLTLTDALDQIVHQQTLSPQRLNAPDQLLGRRDWSGSLIIPFSDLTHGDQISGYRLHAFYP